MQIDAKSERKTKILYFLRFVPDIFLSAAIAVLFESFVLLFISYLVIQGIRTAMWIWDLLTKWTLFYLAGREHASNLVFRDLVARGYPVVENRVVSVENFLESVRDDKSAPASIRLAASFDLGVLSRNRMNPNFSDQVMLTMILEDAFERYAQHCSAVPPKGAHSRTSE